jgi:hypothetical protein
MDPARAPEQEDIMKILSERAEASFVVGIGAIFFLLTAAALLFRH